jgi:hypothetical protein
MPVAIVGMHRSGTSLLTQLLQRSGLYLGSKDRLFGPNAGNPDGYWEHTGFHRLNEAVLTDLGGSWEAPPPVPERWEGDPRLAGHAAEARRLLGEFSGREPWGWKDPRTSLTLSLWLELIPDLKVVVCIRNPLEVACSLRRRDPFFSYSKAIRLWRLYNDGALQTTAAQRIVVSYERLLRGSEAELARVLRFVGIAADARVVRDAARAARDDLRHIRFGMADLHAVDCHPEVVELYAYLRVQAAAGWPGGDQAQRSNGSERILDEEAVGALVAPQLEAAGGPLVAPPPAADDRDAAPGEPGRIARIKELVRDATAPGSTVAVISKGDERLGDLLGRTALHFPQDEQGAPLGYHPSSGRSAVAQLESVRASGADYLLVPAPSGWWLEHYPEFRRHLRTRYRPLRSDAETARLFDLRAPLEPAGRARAIAIEMIDAVRSALGREPALLDWGTALGLGEVMPQARLFARDPGYGELPHTDASVDVVAVRAADADTVREARRAATIEFAADDQLSPVLQLKLPQAEDSLREVSIVLDLADRPATGAFLRSFEETLPHDFKGELVVVDARRPDEPDRVLERLASRCERTKVIRPGPALGPLSAANEGMRASVEPTLVLLRSDVLLLPGWLRPLLDVLRQRPDAGAVGGVVLAPDGTLVHAGGLVFRDGSALDVGYGSAHPDDAPFSHVRRVDFCTSLVLATRRQGFLDAAGFEGRLSTAHAEVDYCMLIQQLGMECYFQPASAVVDLNVRQPGHGHGTGLKAAPADGLAGLFRGWTEALELQPLRPERLDAASPHCLLAGI